MLIIFSILISIYSLILLFPKKLNFSRNFSYLFLISSIIIFSIFSTKFGYDIGNYKKWIDSYIDTPLIEQFNLLYSSKFFLIIIAKIVGDYNILFTFIFNILVITPCFFLLKNRNIYFIIAFFSNLIFFVIGNFKLGTSVPILVLLFQDLLNYNYLKVVFLLIIAVSLHPQNVILGVPIFYIFILRNLKTLKTLKISYLNLIFIFSLILIIPFTYLLFTKSSVIFEILSRYVGEENIIFSIKTRLLEISYQISFLFLLFNFRNNFFNIKFKELWHITFISHLLRLIMCSIISISPYLYGRGLLPLLMIDVLFYNFIFVHDNTNEKYKYGFRILIALRLISTCLFGSLHRAIVAYLN